jgi:hypothetical protein
VNVIASYLERREPEAAKSKFTDARALHRPGVAAWFTVCGS